MSERLTVLITANELPAKSAIPPASVPGYGGLHSFVVALNYRGKNPGSESASEERYFGR